MEKLQELYNSEINFSISCFWDGGFDCQLGDPMNGIIDDFKVDTLEEATISICESAIEHFPNSRFAKENQDFLGSITVCDGCGFYTKEKDQGDKCPVCDGGEMKPKAA